MKSELSNHQGKRVQTTSKSKPVVNLSFLRRQVQNGEPAIAMKRVNKIKGFISNRFKVQNGFKAGSLNPTRFMVHAHIYALNREPNLKRIGIAAWILFAPRTTSATSHDCSVPATCASQSILQVNFGWMSRPARRKKTTTKQTKNMSDKTKIQWTDSTDNFWSGCTKVSSGCTNCYAEARDKRQLIEPVSHWGKGALRLKTISAVKQALALNRMPWICDACGAAFPDPFNDSVCPDCRKCGSCHRRRIFSLSLGDWLDHEVPVEWLAEMLDTIRRCDQVTWILCTKRPENFGERLDKAMEILGGESSTWVNQWRQGNPPKNIILLTSIENQEMATKRIPQLLEIPAACRGLSLEPLLGSVSLNPICLGHEQGLHWLILGGESGVNARPCAVEWIRSLLQQGMAAGVATFVKQLGAAPQLGRDDVQIIRDKKGGDISEWPKDLQVREFPKGF
jgi:protein gp37